MSVNVANYTSLKTLDKPKKKCLKLKSWAVILLHVVFMRYMIFTRNRCTLERTPGLRNAHPSSHFLSVVSIYIGSDTW